MTPAWLQEAGRGMCAVEQLTEYRRELRAGDLVSIHTALIEVKPKALRFRHEMRRDGVGDVVSVSTLTAVHLDTALRKGAAFPAALLQQLEARVEPR